MIAPVQMKSDEMLYAEKARQLVQAQLPDSPEWLQDLRLRALSRFEALGFPTRRLEAWKYISLRPLLNLPLETQTPEPKVCPPALQRHLLGDSEPEGNQDVARLVFINGCYRPDLSTPVSPQEGLIITNLKSAIQTYPELIKSRLGKNTGQETDAFAALNTALFEDGTFVHLADGVEFKPLLQVVYVNFGDDSHAVYPRNLVALGKNARINMVIEHLGLSPAETVHNSVNEIMLDEQAQAEVTLILSEGPNSWHLAATENTLQTSAKLSVNTIALSGDVNRHSVRTLLQGEHAEMRLNGLDVLVGKTEIYHHTVMEHWVPNCVSDQLYKDILDDQGKSEFNSLVFVAKGALGTDSHQLHQALMLSDDSRVWTRPQLQINADDVKCAHGAAVGQLDEKQLFYLASRGIDPELAQSLLTYGFAEDVIQRIGSPLVRKYLDERVLGNLHRTDAAFKQQLGA